MNWYLAVLKNYVGFSGRAGRTEYWMFALFNFIIFAVLAILAAVTRSYFFWILYAIYALAAPRDACRSPCVRVESLSPREAFVELLKGTFNRRLTNQSRLARQFRFAASLTDLVAVKKLTYPRAIERLPEVREAVRADRARDARPALNIQPGFLD